MAEIMPRRDHMGRPLDAVLFRANYLGALPGPIRLFLHQYSETRGRGAAQADGGGDALKAEMVPGTIGGMISEDSGVNERTVGCREGMRGGGGHRRQVLWIMAVGTQAK